jgi:hypothetical protein
MSNIVCIRVSRELKENMKKFHNINWSDLIRGFIEETISRLEARSLSERLRMILGMCLPSLPKLSLDGSELTEILSDASVSSISLLYKQHVSLNIFRDNIFMSYSSLITLLTASLYNGVCQATCFPIPSSRSLWWRSADPSVF